MRQGAEAHKKTIKDLFRPKVLHIATHGYFEPRHEETPEEYAGPKDAKKAVKSNPLWRSGLLLSKTTPDPSLQGGELGLSQDPNSPLSKGGQGGSDLDKNGILTAYEVMNLNLDGTDLVILSACETGLGEVKYGKGVYGLQRSFKVAGAKNILMSLWKVDDAVTQEMMALFYDIWIREEPNTRKAFVKMQAILRAKYPEPYYWGAFVMVGE
jgi:CHAT domain-containing protein